MRWCKQCKRDRPDDKFLPMKTKRFRVTLCDDCAQENMARWARSGASRMKPEDIKELAD